MLAYSRVNDDLFETLENFEHLEHLSFGGTKMSGTAITSLKLLPALKELDLSGQKRADSGPWNVPMSDARVREIAQIPRLEMLDLGATNVSDRGLLELARLKHLHTLGLRGTRVTSKGIAALIGLRELRQLNLWRARGIDDAAIAAFLQMPARRDARVDRDQYHGAKGLERLCAKRA